MDTLLNNPLYMGIAAVLAVVLVFTLIKKLLKWAVIIVVILAVYLFWVMQTSDNPEQTVKKHIETGKKQIEKVVDESKKVEKKVEKAIPDDLKKKAGDMLKKD